MSDDLEMIKHPDRWPIWPVLPLKRTTTGHLETAFCWNHSLVDDTALFYVGNIYDRENAVKDATLSPEQIIEAGWRVD